MLHGASAKKEGFMIGSEEGARLYPDVTYEVEAFLEEVKPCIYHSRYAVHDFYFTDRLDLYAVVDPGEKILFIDTGWWELCGTEALDRLVERVGVPWNRVEVFITHFHNDHDGNLQHCLDRGAETVYHGPKKTFSEKEFETFLRASGARRMDDAALLPFVELLMGRGVGARGESYQAVTVDGEPAITVGDYRFTPLLTPGHCPEHLCLLEAEKGILFAGDHVLDSAPGLMQYEADSRLLKLYLDSLENLKTRGLETVYLSHHDALEGTDVINAFISSIVAKYEKPLTKMRTIMCETHAPLSAYDAAREFYSYLPMGFDGEADQLRTRRLMIAFSYLEYLHDCGEVSRMTDDDGTLLYR